MEYIEQMTDAELKQATQTCMDDLAIAARDENNTEWHEACFAAAVLFSGEMNRRGLKLVTAH